MTGDDTLGIRGLGLSLVSDCERAGRLENPAVIGRDNCGLPALCGLNPGSLREGCSSAPVEGSLGLGLIDASCSLRAAIQS